MPRAFYTNNSAVPLLGKQPGQVFEIEVDDDGEPMETFWRKRQRDGDIAPRVSASTPAASPTVDEVAPKKAVAKKGA